MTSFFVHYDIIYHPPPSILLKTWGVDSPDLAIARGNSPTVNSDFWAFKKAAYTLKGSQVYIRRISNHVS